jgi:hypothetical protein
MTRLIRFISESCSTAWILFFDKFKSERVVKLANYTPTTCKRFSSKSSLSNLYSNPNSFGNDSILFFFKSNTSNFYKSPIVFGKSLSELPATCNSTKL